MAFKDSITNIALTSDANKRFEAICEANNELFYSRKEFIRSKLERTTPNDFLPSTFAQDENQTQLRAYALRIKTAQEERQAQTERKAAQAKADFLKGLLGE